MKESTNQELQDLIRKALGNPGLDIDKLKEKPIEEILETLSIYQQELEFQNKELAHSYEQIEATSKRYKELFDEAPIGYLALNQKSVILDCNKKCEKLFGVSKEKIVGKEIHNFIASDYQDQWYLFLKKAWQQKESISSTELKFLGKEEEFYADVNCQTSISESKNEGKLMRISLSDISSKRETQLELQLAHELLKLENQKIQETSLRLRQIHKMADLGFWEYEPESGIFSWSSEMFNIMDMEPEKFNGLLSDFFKRIHPDDWQGFENAFENHLLNGIELEIDFRVVTAQKTGKHLLLHCQTIFDAEKKPQRTMGTVLDITRLKVAEEESTKNLNQFNAIARSIEEVFWLRDKENKNLLYLSPSFENLFGIKPNEFNNRSETFFKILHPDDVEIVKQRLSNPSKSERQEQTYRIIHPTKGVRWINSTSGPVYDSNGNIVNFSGIARDITEGKLREMELNQTREMLEKTANMAKIGSFELDLINQKLTWSNQTKAIHELPDDFEPNLETAILFYDADFSRAVLERAVKTAIETGLEYDLELQIITAKGNKKWVRTIGKTMYENGKCIKLFGTFQDIHQLRLFEEALQKERDRLNNVIEGTNVGTWEWNVQTGETIFNERWAAILGYTLLDLFPTTIQTFDRLTHPEDLDGVNKKLEDYFKGEAEFYEAEYRMLHKDGHYIWILDKGKVFEYTSDGKPLIMAGTHQDITERKENEIRISQLSLAVEQSPVSIVITNLAGEIEYVNKKFSEVTGYSRDEAFGQNPRILKSGNKPSTEYEKLWNNITHGQTWTGEFLNKKKDGSFYWEQASISPLKNNKGEITHFIAVKEDITDKKEALWKLEDSERKYRQISENMSDMVFTIDANMNATYVSPSSYKIFGISPEEYKTNALLQCYTEESQQIILESIEKLRMQKERIEPIPVRELEGIHSSGKRIWVEIKLEAIRDEHHKLTGYIGVCSDITKRKKAELELRESEFLLSDLINFSGATVYRKDLDGRYELVNQQFEKTLGLAAEDILGKTDFDLFPTDIAEMFLSHDQQVIQQGNTIQVEEWHPETWTSGQLKSDKEKAIRYFFSNKFPVRNSEGKIIGTAGVSFETTQLKRVEQELSTSQTRYRELFEYSPIGMSTVAPNHQVIMLNQKFTEITGYSPSEIPDVTTWQLLAYPDEAYRISIQQKRLKLIQEAEHAKSAYVSMETKVRCKDGSYKYLDIGYMNFNEYAVYTFMDITSRVKAIQELRQSEQRFRNLFEANASPMYLLDASSLNMVDVNNAALQFYGFNRDEFLRLNLKNINPKTEEVKSKIEKLRTEKHIRTELKHRLKDGTVRDVEAFSTLLESGNLELVHEIVHDITERNQYFEALENQNKVMRDIAWTQSHVVRAPLARLMGLMDVFVEKDFSILPENELIKSVKDSANELDKVIKNIAEKTYVANNINHNNPKGERTEPKNIQTLTQEVLLVDDDEMIQTIHKTMVQKSGLSQNPRLMPNGLEALQFLRSRNDKSIRFLLFLDINMPKMTGWEFLDEITKAPLDCEINVVILTSSVEIQDRLKAQQYPQVIEYLTKPITSSILADIKNHPRLKLPNG